MAEEVRKPPARIVQRHLYCQRDDHVSYRDASYYDDTGPTIEKLPEELEFDHKLSVAEIEQHFSKSVKSEFVEPKQE